MTSSKSVKGTFKQQTLKEPKLVHLQTVSLSGLQQCILKENG